VADVESARTKDGDKVDPIDPEKLSVDKEVQKEEVIDAANIPVSQLELEGEVI
jgi:hypothetical protein